MVRMTALVLAGFCASSAAPGQGWAQAESLLSQRLDAGRLDSERQQADQARRRQAVPDQPQARGYGAGRRELWDRQARGQAWQGQQGFGGVPAPMVPPGGYPPPAYAQPPGYTQPPGYGPSPSYSSGYGASPGYYPPQAGFAPPPAYGPPADATPDPGSSAEIDDEPSAR